MKTLRDTLILTGICLLGAFFVIFVVPRLNKSIITDNGEEKTLKDETVNSLYNSLNGSYLYRTAQYNSKTANDEMMLNYILHNMKKEDYKTITIEPLKIVCEVNDYIKFIQDDPCNINIYSYDKIIEYEKLYFNKDLDITLEDNKYRGLDCKEYDGHFYCNKIGFKEDVIDYNLFDKALVYKDKIVIYDYYLAFRKEDKECSSYLGEDFCTSEYKGEYPNIDDSTMRKNATYYKSVYIKTENGYYLDECSIVLN